MVSEIGLEATLKELGVSDDDEGGEEKKETQEKDKGGKEIKETQEKDEGGEEIKETQDLDKRCNDAKIEKEDDSENTVSEGYLHDSHAELQTKKAKSFESNGLQDVPLKFDNEDAKSFHSDFDSDCLQDVPLVYENEGEKSFESDFDSDGLKDVSFENEDAEFEILRRDLNEAQDVISDLNMHIEETNRLSEKKKNENEKERVYLENELHHATKQIEDLKTKIEEKRGCLDKGGEGEKVTELEKKLEDANNQIASLYTELQTERGIRDEERRTQDEEIEKLKNSVIEKDSKLKEAFELVETLHAEIRELATHNATQKAAPDEVLKEVQIDCEVHNVTQADRIAKELIAKLKPDNEGQG